MTDSEFKHWLIKNQTPPHTENMIRQVRDNEPFRRVGGGKSNVAGRYPSRKMGHVIQFESHTVEYPFAVFFENDDEILEYYDQPVPVKLTYNNLKGRHLGIIATPDYFTIRADGSAGWEECKTEEELTHLAEKAPSRYYKDDNGCWRSPPGEQYASQFGLYFKIRSSAEIDWVFFRNLIFLQDYQRENVTTAPEIQTYITAIVELYQGISLYDLLLEQNEKFTANDVYRLILNGELYVDLHRYPLGAPQRAPVFSSAHKSVALSRPTKVQTYQSMPQLLLIEPGTGIIWGGNRFTIATVGDGFVWLQNEHNNICKLPISEIESMVCAGDITGIPNSTIIADEITKLFKEMAPKDHKRAIKKREKLAGFLEGTETRKPTRTEYRWLKNYREADVRFNCGLLGLFDRNKEKGNKLPRFSDSALQLLDHIIETEYLVLEQPSARYVYANYEIECGKTGLYQASYTTFCKRIKHIDAQKKAERRKGRRSSYQLQVFYHILTYTTPRHGDRPFEIAHIDHTQLDIELVSSSSFQNLGRPWFTLMIDAYSRRILAFHLSFEPPSYRSCMNVLRMCGLRHRCLPQTIVVDNGKEFKSMYFELFIAMKEITKKERPPAKARFGSLIERMFGTTNTEFIHNLRGNTQIMREVREVTKSNNPENRAVWNLIKLSERLSEFLFDTYDSSHHTGIMDTPCNVFKRGLFLFGKRNLLLPTGMQAFVFSTLPTTATGEATVLQTKGLKINNIYYRAAALNTPAIINTKVQVKYDPYNIGHAFAYVGNNWIECQSDYYAQLKDLTETELEAISTELKADHSLNNRYSQITTQKVAAFIAQVRSTENELIEQKKANEQRGHFSFVTELPKLLPPDPNPTINIDAFIDDDSETDDDEYQILN